MNAAALVTMILVLTVVWGGLFVLVLTAVRKDRKREQQLREQPSVKKDPIVHNPDREQ